MQPIEHAEIHGVYGLSGDLLLPEDTKWDVAVRAASYGVLRTLCVKLDSILLYVVRLSLVHWLSSCIGSGLIVGAEADWKGAKRKKKKRKMKKGCNGQRTSSFRA